MKAVITGGTGFLGRLIAARLIARGAEVCLFDLMPAADGLGPLADKVTVEVGDVGERDLMTRVCAGADVVVHLASMVSAGAEADFDAAIRVNLDGGRAVLDAARANGPATRVLFASSLAVFGGRAMPATVGDMTRPVPQNTYGTTKAMLELLINDMSRKRLIDGRVARLPTVIVRPGRPNAAASSFASGVIREPLMGAECRLPVPRDLRVMVTGYRRCVDALLALIDAPAGAFGDDRVVNLPNRTVTVAEMIAATEAAAVRHGIAAGAVTDAPDPAVAAIVGAWPEAMDDARALALGCPPAADLGAVIDDFVADYVR